MAHYTSRHPSHSTELPDSVDVALVGAGMSSLYVAWRLLEQDPELSIAIIEKLDRTGGRLDSDVIEFPGGEAVKEEEGGMRFTFDTMDDLMSLFLMLDLDDQIVPFPMNSGGNNRLYFRGHAFTNNEAKEDNYRIWSELYDLEAAEQGVDPKSIIDTVFNRILGANPQFTQRPEPKTPEFWQAFRLECSWNGVLLKDWTLWSLLAAMGYSNECVTMLYRLLGFNGTFLSKMNAGEAYQLLEDFPAEPEFRTLKEGFSSLPNALVDRIGMERIFLNTSVLDLEGLDGSDGGYRINYEQRSGDQCNRGSLQAKKVVLGLPRQALEKLFVRSNAMNRLEPETSDALWNTLQTTTDQSLIKINLYYDHAWWGNNLSGQPPVAFGPNFSDLPLGSVYPFYAVDESLAAGLEYQDWLAKNGQVAPPAIEAKLNEVLNAKYDKPAALTIYADYLNINFWRALQQNGELFSSELQEEHSQPPQTIYAASEAVVQEATRLFKLLFNTHYVPRPVMTSARIWSGSTLHGLPPAEQFGFGVHQWGLHADDRQVIRDLVEPLEGLYTCGEAFSDFQGWVEGALRSADLVLKQGFGLDPIKDVYQKEHGVTSSEAIKASYAKNSAALIRKHIDPDFDPHCDSGPGAASDGTAVNAAPERFNVNLSYFDRA